MKFTILIYGCQMNYADSARIKMILENCNFIYTPEIPEADIVIFTSCSVRQKSADKILGKLTQISSHQKIWITGCFVGHHLKNIPFLSKIKFRKGNFYGSCQSINPDIIGIEEIENLNSYFYGYKGPWNHILINHCFNPLFKKLRKKFLNLELFWRIDDTGYLPIILHKIGYQTSTSIQVIKDYQQIIPSNANQLFINNSKSTYLSIQNGCSQFCAYCIVPYARGLEKNRSSDDILQELKMQIKHGIEEVILIGQIVNKHPEFNYLIKQILKFPEIKRIRYTSPYPTYYNEELLVLHAGEAKLCPHIHLPIQSGSDLILQKMGRGYKVSDIYRFIDKINKLPRKISLTTDIIIGFPNEGELEFADTVNLIKYAQFDMIYLGIYSPRPGTLAAFKYTDNVHIAIKKQRRNILNDLLNISSYQNNQQEINLLKNILITQIQANNLIGYDEKMKTVVILGNNQNHYNLGQFLKVKIIKAEALKLFGEII